MCILCTFSSFQVSAIPISFENITGDDSWVSVMYARARLSPGQFTGLKTMLQDSLNVTSFD